MSTVTCKLMLRIGSCEPGVDKMADSGILRCWGLLPDWQADRPVGMNPRTTTCCALALRPSRRLLPEPGNEHGRDVAPRPLPGAGTRNRWGEGTSEIEMLRVLGPSAGCLGKEQPPPQVLACAYVHLYQVLAAEPAKAEPRRGTGEQRVSFVAPRAEKVEVPGGVVNWSRSCMPSHGPPGRPVHKSPRGPGVLHVCCAEPRLGEGKGG